MTVTIDQPQIGAAEDVKGTHTDSKELLLDGGFVMPDTNAFGHTFSKYDLYSKSKVRVDVEKVKPYYLLLIEKYFPAKLRW